MFHGTKYGADVTSAPKFAPSSLNCTPATATLSLAVALTVVGPETVAPCAGAVTATVGGVLSAPGFGAPDGTIGAVAFLLIVTTGDTFIAPATSVATACVWYAPFARGPVIHQSSSVQLVPVHVFCKTTPPLP